MKTRIHLPLFGGVLLAISILISGIGNPANSHKVHQEEKTVLSDSADHPLHTMSSRLDGRTVTVEDGDILEISSFGSDLSYDITEIRAKAGTELTIRYVNASTMPHNILFVNTEEDINIVGIAALQAYQNEYVPENEMDRIFAYSELARPDETIEMTLTIPEEPGSYPYICTYPGHFTSMQGRLIVTE